MTKLTQPLVGDIPFEIHHNEPTEGHGGAPSIYVISWTDKDGVAQSQEIKFQDGARHEVGWNGVLDQSLTAILIHRIECWQAGPFSNRENALVKTALEESLLWRLKRVLDRTVRGVMGQHKA